jgi:hypothetical protein
MEWPNESFKDYMLKIVEYSHGDGGVIIGKSQYDLDKKNNTTDMVITARYLCEKKDHPNAITKEEFKTRYGISYQDWVDFSIGKGGSKLNSLTAEWENEDGL